MEKHLNGSRKTVLAIALGTAPAIFAHPLIIKHSDPEGIVVEYEGDVACSYDVLHRYPKPGEKPGLGPFQGGDQDQDEDEDEDKCAVKGAFVVGPDRVARIEIAPDLSGERGADRSETMPKGELVVRVRRFNGNNHARFRIVSPTNLIVSTGSKVPPAEIKIHSDFCTIAGHKVLDGKTYGTYFLVPVDSSSPADLAQ